MRRVCKQCGKEFVITNGEVEFYADKGLELPKRCEECRHKNKTSSTRPSSPQPVGKSINTDFPRTFNSGSFYRKNKRERLKYAGVLISILTLIFVFIFSIGDWFSESDNYVENTTQQNSYVDTYVQGFRNSELLQEHYTKHGIHMGFQSAVVYEQAAINVANNANALHKIEAEDGDDVYYLQSTNDFVIVSTDGYIRTYFRPDDGIAYFNRQ